LISELHYIEQLLKSEVSFVAYRKPFDNIVTIMVQQNNFLYKLDNYSQKGFVVAPFDIQEDAFLFPLEKCEISTIPISDKEKELIPVKDIKENKTLIEKAKIYHINLVNKGIDFLGKEKARKVVLSRKEEIYIGQLLKSELFSELIQNYPSTFVSYWHHPEVGSWMGATPENLLSVQNNVFKTMSLAGTQKFKGIQDVEWGDKEKEEQQIVTDFILNELKDFDLKTSKPFTIKAGGLLHICTEIRGELSSGHQLETLINKLHPTPAVCGLPKYKAREFILENENYDREFYAGFLGELNINNTSDLYVNLRCMQFNGSKANLYIGGGITSDSDPFSEWKETVAKSEVIKRFLF